MKKIFSSLILALMLPLCAAAQTRLSDSQLANAYSGVGACAAHQWVSTINRNAAPSCSQPSYADISGTPTLRYQTIKVAGVAQPQEPNLNFPSGVSCSDNPGASSTDCSPTTGGSGTVTSVGVTVPSFLSVSGSPVTGAGTIAITAAGAQPQNQVMATPDGASGAAGLRALVSNDIPALAESKITSLSTDLAAKLAAASNLSDLGSAATARTNLGLGSAATAAATAFSGVGACAAHTWTSTINGNAAPTCTQPSYADISGTPTLEYQTIQNASGVDQTQRGKVEFTGSGVSSVTDDAANNRTVVTLSGSGGGGIPPTVTVATLPASPAANTDAIISDGKGDTCATGGGSTLVHCRYNGTAWQVVGYDNTNGAIVIPNNTAIGAIDATGTLRGFLTYDSSNTVNLLNPASNGQINIAPSGQLSLGPTANWPVIVQNNNLSTMRCRQFDVLNQLNGCNIGSNFGTDPTRTLTLKDNIASSSAHTQVAIVAAQGDASTDRPFETLLNDGTTVKYSQTRDGFVDNYDGVPTAGVGVVPVLGVVSTTGKIAAVTTTTLCSSANCPAGAYEVDVYAASTVTCTTPGSAAVGVQLTWTDDAGTKSAQTIPLDVNGGNSLAATMALGNTTNSATGHALIYVNSGNTSYATSYTGCTTGTGTYSLRVAMRRLL